MPLLRKKGFQTSHIPELLRDDEQVFHCEITNEIFRDYDEYCQRIILVNSMVWSCAMTGKTNLTYAEALQSEKAAKKNLKDFPTELRIPVLYLANKTKRTAFGEMAEDVFSFVKDRYFVGEIVESSFTENNWRESHVLQVIAPNEEQIASYSQTNGKSPSDRSYHPPSGSYRYEVEQLDANDQDSSHVMIVEASHIRRKKGPFSKEKMRLFLKQFVELNSLGIVIIKELTRRKYKLDHVRFDRIFDGPLPDFEQSKKMVKAVNGKKARQETMSKFLEKNKKANETSYTKSLLEEMKRKEEEYKKKVTEMKQKRAEEKIIEKQKRKEESLKMNTYVREWYKVREDLELEDQKKLPVPTLVQSKIPSKYYGDALMILEFSKSFSTFLSTKDFFSGGLTMDLIERALIEKEVAGPLTDIIQMLLTAIFNVQDEEAAENKATQTDLNSEDMYDSMTLSEASRLATLAYNWSIKYQGMPLSRLPVYPLTITEVLRLHLLSSGARLSEAATKWRYQQRGGYTNHDDPGLTLRIKHPHILKALAVHNVNHLPIGDKIKILSCLVDQLLTYADVRDTIEERLEKSRQLKVELRSLQVAEKKLEQELVSARLKIKRENKGQENTIDAEYKKLETEHDKKRTDIEKKIRDITTKSLPEHQVILGTDRAYQRYIKIDALPGFFVENDEQNPGICADKIVVQRPELINAAQEETLVYVKKLFEEYCSSDKENDNGMKKKAKKVNGTRQSIKVESDIENIRELLMCTANNLTCPVHSNNQGPSWSFYYDKDDIQTLINSLNKRGVRENELKQTLENIKVYLERVVTETNAFKLNSTLDIKVEDNVKEKPILRKEKSKVNRYEDSNLGYPPETDISEIQNLSLIDTILEMEEKIFVGNLGSLKVKDRKKWRNNLENRKYEELDKTLIKKEKNPQIEKLQAEGRNSRPGTPDSLTYKDPGKYLGLALDLEASDSEADSENIALTSTNEQLIAAKTLAIALTQVAQGVDTKYLKKPLGHADGNPKKKEEIDVIERWEQSLLASTSYSQVFLHYCTLDNCIMWGRSIQLARCRICHRQRDPENMLLCDSCNKGHHLYCLKPKLTAVPKGDWFCDKCKPKEKSPPTRASRRERKIFTEESDDDKDDDDDDDDDDEENEAASDDADSNEDEETVAANGVAQNDTNLSMFEVCEVCGSGGHVICCDFCPKVYHLECTQPPLRRVPRGEWRCHKCKRRNDKQKDSDSGGDEELPQRRSTRRTHESKGGVDDDDDLPLHNAALQELLSDVMKHKHSWPFTRPVLKHEVPDYYDVIKNPMDFGKIKYKLNMGEYTCDADVMDDCALVFENCDTYNNSEAVVYKCGVKLLKYFEKLAQELGLRFPEGVMGDVDSVDEDDDDNDDDDDDDAPPQSKKMRIN